MIAPVLHLFFFDPNSVSLPVPMLRSIDLFSDMGGMSHALRGFVSPLAYCEPDPVCRATLDARIASGDLGPVTVLADMRDTGGLMAVVGGQVVDVVTVGAGCSSIALVDDALAIIAIVNPPMIFMQNDRKILRANAGHDYTSILRRIWRLGYRVTWCVLSAEHAGAWHRQKTWFALAYRPATLRARSIVMSRSWPSVKRFSWSMTTKPCRLRGPGQTVCDRNTDIRADSHRRLQMLSESIVPDCTRLAFVYLFSGGAVTDIRKRTIKHKQFETETTTNRASSRSHPAFGITSTQGVVLMHREVLVSKPVRVRCRGMPEFHNNMNPHFVEFLMGFPRNWTSMRLPVLPERRPSL